MAGKGGLAIMIGLGKKKPGAAMDSEDDSEDGSADAEKEAFGSFAESVGKDNDAAMDAFKSFIELCYPSLAKGGYSEGDSEEGG